MSVATVLTVSRVLLIPPTLVLLNSRTRVGVVSAFILFGLAVATDFMDGFIARKFDQLSALGGFLDPLCDKLVIYSLALFFVAEGTISIAFALPIFVRDLVVDGLRSRSAWKGRVLPANRWGKIKFNLQVVALALAFVTLLGPGKAESFSVAANTALGAALMFSLPGVLLLVRGRTTPGPETDA
jgi:CDP-diacylglycerol--glycerol-3-phosphate 3-phosphatidyltransferase